MTNLRDFNKDFNLDSSLNTNDFISSLKEQYESGKTLSKAQLDCLIDYSGKKIELPEYKTKKVNLYYENFYRLDYHGDYLCSSNIVIDDGNLDLNEKIQDAHAAQYSYEDYIDKYNFKETVSVPCLNNLNKFLSYKEDYDFLTKKLNRNKFRSVRSFNNCVRALNSILDETYSQKLLDKATGRSYRF